MFRLEAPYWLTEPNTLCSDKGAISVTDKDECYLTLPFVRQVYPSADENIALEISKSDRPTGCYFGTHVLFNSHETGGRHKGSEDICKTLSK